MTSDREYELKFSFPEEATERLVSHPTLRAALPERRLSRMVSTYFDTADCSLHRRRISLRVRRSGNRSTQTLKRAGPSLVERDEWEHEVAGSSPDLAWLRTTPLKDLFETDAPIDARFAVEVERTILPIAFKGAKIEAALDHGSVRSAGLSLPINEIELELKEGRKASVAELARHLAREMPLVLSLASKAERGFAVADLTWGRPSKSLDLDLSQVKTLAQVFEAVVQSCLHGICYNAALVGTTRDEVDAVHKTRILVRHLRAALDLFGPVLRRKHLKAVRAEIKWMSDLLGAARDADVFQTSVFDKAAEAMVVHGADTLATFTRGDQSRAHDCLHRALASARWRLLLVDLAEFSETGVRRSLRHRRYRSFVRKRLEKRRHTLADNARRIRTRTPDALHEIRKRAKMLRYATEFFDNTEVADHRLAEALQVLQQCLGEIHDGQALDAYLDARFSKTHKPAKMAQSDWRCLQDAASALKRCRAHTRGELDDARSAVRVIRARSTER